MRTLVLFCMVMACGKKTQVHGVPIAYTLRGAITLANPATSGVSNSQFTGGDISIVLFASNGAGYCLQGQEAIAAEAPNQVATTSISKLQSGIGYELQVLEVPGQTYPVTVYPEAVMLNSDSFEVACVAAADGGAPLYAARGYYGVSDQSALAAFNLSACCGIAASPLTITAQGQVVTSVDFALAPAPTPVSGCTAPGVPFDRCTLRHSDTGTDSACWTALGDDAAKWVVQANGQPCP